jgi:hypothetical protein
MQLSELSGISPDEIYPDLSLEAVSNFISEYDQTLFSKLKGVKKFEDIPTEIKDVLNQVYISKNLKTITAIKARFIHYMQFAEELNDFNITHRNAQANNLKIDLVLHHNARDEVIWVLVLDYFDRLTYKSLEKSLVEIIKSAASVSDKKNPASKIPDEILLVCGKVDRRLAVDKSVIQHENVNVKLSYYIEYLETARPFEDDDYILIEDLKIRGFNFNSMDFLLNVVKKILGKGQYSIKCETPQGEKKTIWEGILFPKEIFQK